MAVQYVSRSAGLLQTSAGIRATARVGRTDFARKSHLPHSGAPDGPVDSEDCDRAINANFASRACSVVVRKSASVRAYAPPAETAARSRRLRTSITRFCRSLGLTPGMRAAWASVAG